MSAAIALNEPAELRAGFTWQWKRQDLPDYPAPTWTLKYAFKNAAQHFEVTADADGSNFSVTLSASTTGGYTAGKYSWVAWVESGSEKHQIDQGWLRVLASFTGATALDDRSHARKMLDAIEAALEGKATSSQLDAISYSIGTRSKSFAPELLLKLRARYEVEVAAEDAANGNFSANVLRIRL